jgi:hypothetical protein
LWLDGRPFFIAEDAFVIDGKVQEKLGKVSAWAFSEDRRQFAYAVDIKSKRHVVRDGKLGPAISQDLSTQPVFSPDGSRLAYIFKDGDKVMIQIDDERVGGEFDNLGYDMRFSPDGKRFAYSVFKDGKYTFVVDGVVQGPGGIDSSEGADFSGDGKHFAWVHVAKKNRSLVIDGVPAAEGFGAIDGLAWMPKSKCFAAIAQRGDELLLLRAS